MGSEQIIVFVNIILGIAYRLWEKADQIKTKQIPTWEQIADKNAILQAEIDREMADPDLTAHSDPTAGGSGE